jgi:hypothetical protein
MSELSVVESLGVGEGEVVDVRPHDRRHSPAARRGREFLFQEEATDSCDRVEAIDVAAGEEERVALDERLPQVRGCGVVGARPTAARVRERDRGRIQEDDRGARASTQIVRMADADPADGGERAIRSDARCLRGRGPSAGYLTEMRDPGSAYRSYL